MKEFFKNLDKKRLAKNSILLLIGNFLYAFGVFTFIEQNHLITGGITGISIFIHYLTGWNTSLFVLGFNIVLFTIGCIFLGKKFIAGTLASSILYPLIYFLFEMIPASFISQFQFTELWLNVICAGVLMGVGIGLVMRTGGSTGGLDIPALIIHKYVAWLTVGICVTILDVATIFFQLFADGINLGDVVCGIVIIVIYSLVIDKVVLLGSNKIEVKVISHKQEEIRYAIIHELDRGITLLHSKTGYLKEELDTILTVVDVRELQKVEQVVHAIDPEAFMVVTQVKEVSGRGFSVAKKYESEENV